MSRDIDWRKYLNKLVFCYGCGRLGLPRRGKTLPTGWKLLYQPHPDGIPGLTVCSQDCNDAVRLAMMTAPVTAPLALPEPGAIMLPAEVRETMEAEVEEELVREAVDPESWAEAEEREAQHAKRAEPVDSDTEEGETDGGDLPSAQAGSHDQEPPERPEEEPERGDG